MKAKILILGLILLAIISCKKGIENPYSPEFLPNIMYFNADPTGLFCEGTSILSWKVTRATTVKLEIAGAIIDLPVEQGISEGTKEVAPSETTIYYLIAKNDHGSVEERVTVKVTREALMEFYTLPYLRCPDYDPLAEYQSARVVYYIINNGCVPARNIRIVLRIWNTQSRQLLLEKELLIRSDELRVGWSQSGSVGFQIKTSIWDKDVTGEAYHKFTMNWDNVN